MAYSFKHKDCDVQDGLRRIAVSQIESALDELQGGKLSQSDMVHQARKRCKKLRGLLRFVRKSFPDYSAENETFRDAARTLSEVRDATATLKSLDELEACYASELRMHALDPLRKKLQERRTAISEKRVEDLLAGMRSLFREALERAQDWSLDERDEAAFQASIAKTYKRARKAMAAAKTTGDPADFHEWRKRVKYHWYHTRLLKRLWPDVTDGYVDEASALADDLGEHHDLAVLGVTAEELLGDEKAETWQLVQALASARQAELAEACFERGERLLAEKPDQMAERWAALWQIYCEER